uniref:G-protein-signaling modulator 2-like n=1 Tax=Paramormyrops kingsleyae TaxID=1676925 RepID=A0A3B3RNA6_9TELE|nr:G-protein-signaling modulator 2-like isoform X1 [Paramormyrops kingsleyae]
MIYMYFCFAMEGRGERRRRRTGVAAANATSHRRVLEAKMESCLELALKGERLCKEGSYGAGVSCFEAAMQIGTGDLQMLSAIYSQLGNAYFHLDDYAKALEFHRYDLTLTKTIGDQLGEAKASGNIGNTLKVLGRFEEAIFFCQNHLDISRILHDKVGEARALYSLGNVYHARGRSFCWSGPDPSDFPKDTLLALRMAVRFYEANLLIVKELGDRAAQGRTYGNLGNTHYMLGDYGNAIVAHEQRLLIAKEFGDKAAERRACCNLGNAYIFLGEFEVAAEHYKRTLQLARQLQDRAVEAQAFYSLGNTYTLLQDYKRAIDYHHRHLVIAQDLNDRVGERCACWSLGNAYTALGNLDQAMHFAKKHLEISKETGDQRGELTASMNVSDLQAVLGLRNNSDSSAALIEIEGLDTQGEKPRAERRGSVEKIELVKLCPDKISEQKQNPHDITSQAKVSLAKTSSRLSFVSRLRAKMHRNSRSALKAPQNYSNSLDVEGDLEGAGKAHDMLGDEVFFDLLSRFQSSRMDDQRCNIQEGKSHISAPSSPTPPLPRPMKKSHTILASSPHEPFLDAIASFQNRRLDEQRASADLLPGLRVNQQHHQSVLSRLKESGDAKEPSEDFFDTLVKCQSSRLDDQRCAGPLLTTKSLTVPDDDFFSLILQAQAKRMDEQRATFCPFSRRPSSS